jgi:hypothetical protein
MVNHLRTVLLNVTAAVAPDAVYIDPAFRPILVPDWLRRLQQLILPYTADASRQSFQLATIMRLLHAADYERFVLLPDTRVTYRPVDDSAFFGTTSDPTVDIDFDRLYQQVQNEISEINRQRQDLFRSLADYPMVAEELRQIWNSDLIHIGRLTGAILALGYQLDALRT